MELTERIKSIREGKRIKLSEIATALNVDVSNYAKIEKKGKKLTIERIEEIAFALGVSSSHLLGYDNGMELEDMKETVSKIESENKYLKSNNNLLVLVIALFNQLLEDDILVKNPLKEGDYNNLREKISQALSSTNINDLNSKGGTK